MDWEKRYRSGDTPWDKGTATPVLDEIFTHDPGLFQGRWLVPGCGAGYDARRLAVRGCAVTAWDVSPLAVELARSLDPEHRVDFHVENFLTARGPAKFEGIFEHTFFCAIKPSRRSDYVAAAHSLLLPGGRLAGVFFIDPEMDEGEQGPPFGVAVAEMEEMWRAGGFEINDSWVPATGFEGRHGRERVMLLHRL
ncbi:MAG: methyltransferase domain-containing protein [Verrucomicrobiota bacterium]